LNYTVVKVVDDADAISYERLHLVFAPFFSFPVSGRNGDKGYGRELSEMFSSM
jgi:hypothetical protein